MLGPLLVLLFCVSQAFRDVYFANLFQGIDFFAIILIAFLTSTVIFAVVAFVRDPRELRKLRGDIAAVAAMNLTTSLAWSCYFFALTHIEPSIVNTIHSGMGPLTVATMGALGFKLAQSKNLSRGEAVSYAGIGLSLVALWWVVLTGRSGLPVENMPATLAGLALIVMGGASITVSMLYSKRLHDQGVSSEAVTAVRYLALIMLAGAVEAHKGSLGGIAGAAQIATLSMVTTVLIVLPLFALQVGIARTRTLTSNTIRALGPVFIFALQQFDGRTRYSTPTLACILLYSASVVLSNVAHGWRESPRATPPVAPPRTARAAR